MSLATIFGIAGFGYLLNDYSDREEDRKAGKFNLLNQLPGGGIVALGLLFLALALLPWLLYFPRGWSTLGLLGLELLLFALYSLPPFRFKERGLLGLLCDAGYAHAIPAVLAALTFFYLGNRSMAHLYPLLATLGAWQGLLGIRNILLHQWQDLDKDLATGTRTFATQIGHDRLLHLLNKWVIPLEIIASLAFAAVLSLAIWWLLPFLAVGLAYTWYRIRAIDELPLPHRMIDRLGVWMDDLALLWFPLFTLCLLSAQDARYLLLWPLHIFLFRNALSDMYRRLRQWTATQRVKWAAFAFASFLLAQGAFAVVQGDFSTAFFFPLYHQAPPSHGSMEAPSAKAFLVSTVGSGDDIREIDPAALFQDLPASAIPFLLRDNMGPDPARQNHEEDFRQWLAKRLKGLGHGGIPKRLKVQWGVHSIPGSKTAPSPHIRPLGSYEVHFPIEEEEAHE